MHNTSVALPILIVGGGVAGMQAALNLADSGKQVLLVEQDSFLGGQVMRLDKVYPTDHCAFCPVWPYAKACRNHPGISVHTRSRFVRMENESNEKKAIIVRTLPPVDPEACVFCGRCLAVCPQKAILSHPADLPWDPAAPPAAFIDASLCDACGKCVSVCPTGAIDLSRHTANQQETLCIPVSDCIFAGGFYEPKPGPAPEYGAHTHPDILTAMAFEAWTAEFRPNGASRPLCPSDERPVTSIAFLQCAGARDKRYLAHCSAVCCMHAAKQALWMKRRFPEMNISIFYTDLRGPGKGQENYLRRAEQAGVHLFRRRPGLVSPLDPEMKKGILVRHEHNDKVVSTLTDVVVLNGGLASCPDLAEAALIRGRTCGFCKEPADIAQSVIQGADAASRVITDQAEVDHA